MSRFIKGVVNSIHNVNGTNLRFWNLPDDSMAAGDPVVSRRLATGNQVKSACTGPAGNRRLSTA
jgi:hypothetical protein